MRTVRSWRFPLLAVRFFVFWSRGVGIVLDMAPSLIIFLYLIHQITPAVDVVGAIVIVGISFISLILYRAKHMPWHPSSPFPALVSEHVVRRCKFP